MSEEDKLEHAPQDSAIQKHEEKSSALGKEAIFARSFSGPLPPPETLAQYNRIVPGAADRIIKMAEEQSRHRREMEKIVILTNTKESFLGWFSASLLSLVAIAGSLILAYNGQNLSGFGTIIATLVALVSVFIYSKKQQATELSKKKNQEKEEQN